MNTFPFFSFFSYKTRTLYSFFNDLRKGKKENATRIDLHRSLTPDIAFPPPRPDIGNVSMVVDDDTETLAGGYVR